MKLGHLQRRSTKNQRNLKKYVVVDVKVTFFRSALKNSGRLKNVKKNSSLRKKNTKKVTKRLSVTNTKRTRKVG